MSVSGGPGVDDLLARRSDCSREAKAVDKNRVVSPSDVGFVVFSSTVVTWGEVVEGLIESTAGGGAWPSCSGTVFTSAPAAGAS